MHVEEPAVYFSVHSAHREGHRDAHGGPPALIGTGRGANIDGFVKIHEEKPVDELILYMN